MDYSQYENYGFDRVSAFNLSTGYEKRSYQAHWHSYGEILLVGPGKTNIFMVNQKTYELVEGDFLLIWPTEMHAIIDADRKESLVIQYSNAFMNTLFDLQRIMHFYRNLHVLCIKAHPELVGRLRSIAEKMKTIFFSSGADRELRCCMLLMEFMLTLDEHREEFAPEIRSGDPYSYTDTVMRRMLMVTDYIKNNLTADDLSQGAMAEMAGISKDYFSRIFRSVTGLNYSKWLNLIRLEKAAELLADKDMTLTEIAMLSGFQSISSFNRVFHTEKGMSPGEYRALLLPR
ncbi:AraC family transcriptional regulator [Aristaeella lactis]|uniref:AraC-type DNA-binding protein n=1 Tax=Aristaeella lactis TaxID=3046383 RepID=A0AC61PM36_9FIRM|nr:AraC family transcriptional regulator [Aristaeella lactis]QUA53070.1 helix-turn-helix transcriptional regulator [Aristaeella lactis]SMC67260.1 AraC-type DNA-binding protein [Aristaeella lactis]